MKVTATEIGKDFGHFADKALAEPIFVTKSGRDHVVILSAEVYARLLTDRRAWHTSDAPADIVEAVREAAMDSRHGHLDQLLTDDNP